MEFKVKELIFVFLLASLSGCANNQPKDPCADRPVYKEYSITMPERPVLKSSINTKLDGEVVRNAEDDLSLLSEYALKLENLIKSFPKLSIPE